MDDQVDLIAQLLDQSPDVLDRIEHVERGDERRNDRGCGVLAHDADDADANSIALDDRCGGANGWVVPFLVSMERPAPIRRP
jgi:hypothetical protein